MTTVPHSQLDTTSTTSTDKPFSDIVTTGSTYAVTITTTTESILPIRAEATTTAATITTTTTNTNTEEQHSSAVTFTERTTIGSITTTESTAFDVCVEAGCEHLCRVIEDKESAECFCPDGYILAEDGKTCDDVDECSDGSNGGCEVYCWNVPGSFQCLCRKGFVIEDNKKTCTGKFLLHFTMSYLETCLQVMFLWPHQSHRYLYTKLCTTRDGMVRI